VRYYTREVRTGDALAYVVSDTSKWGSGERYFRRPVPGPQGGKGGWEFQMADHPSQREPDPARSWHKTLDAARHNRPVNPFSVWL
jgi:hypothetical protein